MGKGWSSALTLGHGKGSPSLGRLAILLPSLQLFFLQSTRGVVVGVGKAESTFLQVFLYPELVRPVQVVKGGEHRAPLYGN